MHPYRLKILGLDGHLESISGLFLTSEDIIERRRLVAVGSVWSISKPHHQADVEGECVVEARKMALRVEIGEVRNDPPPVFVGRHIPDFIPFTEDEFLLNALDVLYRLIPRL